MLAHVTHTTIYIKNTWIIYFPIRLSSVLFFARALNRLYIIFDWWLVRETVCVSVRWGKVEACVVDYPV